MVVSPGHSQVYVPWVKLNTYPFSQCPWPRFFATLRRDAAVARSPARTER